MIAHGGKAEEMGRLVTSKELQSIYSISRATIDRWRREGMPSIKVGRGVRFDDVEVRDWIRKNKQNS